MDGCLNDVIHYFKFSYMSNYEYKNKQSSILFCTSKDCAPNAQTAVNLFSGVIVCASLSKCPAKKAFHYLHSLRGQKCRCPATPEAFQQPLVPISEWLDLNTAVTLRLLHLILTQPSSSWCPLQTASLHLQRRHATRQ